MRTSENSVKWKSNFREGPKGEVRRIQLPRNRVNRGKQRRAENSGQEISLLLPSIASSILLLSAHLSLFSGTMYLFGPPLR
jgi:hypothetical protein